MNSNSMNFNELTLSFPNNKEHIFRAIYFKSSINQLRVALLLVAFLYGIFALLDFQLYPAHINLFFIIRFLIVIPLILTIFLLSFTKIFPKIWQTLLMVAFIIGGSGVCIMILIEPENYIYFSGLIIIFFAGFFFVKLRFLSATIAGWTIAIIFNLIAIYYAKASDFYIAITNSFFISTNIIGMFGSYNMEHQIRRNFCLNQNLDKEKLTIKELNKNLEVIIAERTEELVKAKEIAENSNSNITAIIEGTTNSIWAFDTNFDILYINHVFQQEFYQAFNVHLKQGMNLLTSLPENLKPIWKPRYDKVLNNEQFSIEDKIITTKGTVYIHVGFTPIIKNGKVVGGSCFGSNITAQKLSEKELLIAKENAEKSDKLKSAFLANMSHEIRTPMNGILGFSNLLQEPHLSGEKQQQYIQIIEKSGKRMLNIINDIMDISKIESGLMNVYLKDTSINNQIDYIYSLFKPETDSKELLFKMVKPLLDDQCIIKTDPEKLEAILSNLVKNAIKYTNKGSIEFGYTQKDNAVQFYVKDTGIGIPKDKQTEIFERFIQADINDIKAREGVGLGLSISKAFLQLLKGKIWLESEENVGSTFYFTIPCNRNNQINGIKNNLNKTIMNSTISGLKILIVEDDEISSELLSIMVENISKEVITANTGVDAVSICKNNSDIDLILMDIQMPDLNGFEATKQIREFNKNVIIIAQTAFGLLGDKEKTIESGCDEYISKPIQSEELNKLIKKFF
ncbi:ATP-binding protein [Lutibacter sp.]|uniref:ATP-binding protein n=1 Tax=Lutibacter sp. TaxID=1925666 RepID=UPI003562EECD